MYLYNITDAQYEEGRKITESLIQELSYLISGRIVPAWSCNCGEVHAGKAAASHIRTPGATYPEQIACFGSWTVEMRDVVSGEFTYTKGISQFLSFEVLDIIFEKYFGDWARTHFSQEYKDAVQQGEPVWF